MATKMCFLSTRLQPYKEEIITFDYVKGLAFSQKQKNVASFHSAIQSKYPNARILEVSTKSPITLGVSLSAFNLKLDGYPIESIFQSSKVFSDGTQFPELMYLPPKEAKQFVANSNKGSLLRFNYCNTIFPLEPRSMFYDYLYIKALNQIKRTSVHLVEFDIFTDIEFNEKKQINCQARSCAIYSYLLKSKTLEYHLSSIENFAKLYPSVPTQFTFDGL